MTTTEEKMHEMINCLCGANPIVEQKAIATHYMDMAVFKYKCSNCKEKELPWLGQWKDCGALQEWNRIAKKRSYHKRTLEYNEHGACIAPPYKVFEWRDKKKVYVHLTLKFYFDNSMYYYSYSYWYKNGGCGFATSIRDKCFPSLEIAKKHAIGRILKGDRNLKKIVENLFIPVQGDLFA